MALYNLVRCYTNTTGQDNLTLGAAVTGFLTFAQAGVPNGGTVSYGIKDGNYSEVGRGVYNSGTLTRNVLASNDGGAKLFLSGLAEVFITVLAEDITSTTETDPVFLASEAASFVTGDKAKLDGIEAGAEINVQADWSASTGDAAIQNKPTIPSTTADIADSLNKRYVTDANLTVIGNTSGTNTGDNATNTQYSGLVSNATHTGDATGATALTVVKVQGKDFPTLSASDDQKYPKYVSASNAFVMTAIAGGGDVTGDDTSTTAQNIVAYSGTGGKNITELTGTQGDVLYHDGTSWAKLGAGTLGQYLETGGAGANPSWQYGAIIHSSKSSGATTTGANTTPVSVSGAVFDYVASAVYRIWVMGRINSTAATTGIGIQFDLSSAVTAIDTLTIHTLTTSTLAGQSSIADDTSQGVTTGVPAGPLDVPFNTNALLVTGANTGTCQLRFRSETTAVTELLAGVVMVVERVA